jgi:hypothetical protein
VFVWFQNMQKVFMLVVVTPQNVRKFSMGIKTQNLNYICVRISQNWFDFYDCIAYGGWVLFQPFAVKKIFARRGFVLLFCRDSLF